MEELLSLIFDRKTEAFEGIKTLISWIPSLSAER